MGDIEFVILLLGAAAILVRLAEWMTIQASDRVEPIATKNRSSVSSKMQTSSVRGALQGALERGCGEPPGLTSCSEATR